MVGCFNASLSASGEWAGFPYTREYMRPRYGLLALLIATFSTTERTLSEPTPFWATHLLHIIWAASFTPDSPRTLAHVNGLSARPVTPDTI